MQRWSALALLACLAAVAKAQERLSLEGPVPATVRLGDSARVRFSIEGRGARFTEPTLPKVDGLQFSLTQPSTMSRTFFDGRNLTERTAVQFDLVIRPLRAGSFVIPKFKIHTGSREQEVAELRVDAVKDIKGEEFGYLDVRVEPKRVYVHEPIRVRVEFGVQKGLREIEGVAQGGRRYVDYEVQAPWLSELDGLEDLPDPPVGTPAVPVVLNRTLKMADYDPEHDRGGKLYKSFVFEKAFLPTRIGKLDLSAPMLRYNVLVREGRAGIFGEPVGQQNENFYIYGQPLSVEVVPIPEQGRPSPFYGAIGRFTIDAALDKDTVKVGGSVKLAVSIRGQGNFEFLRTPELGQTDGFHLLGKTEKRDAEKVVTTYDLRPLRADLTSVPAVAWNYFDTTPGVESFQSVATKALAITVKPLERGETLAALPGTDVKAVTPGVDDVFDLPAFAAGPPVGRPTAIRGAALLAAFGPWLLAALVALLVAFVRRRAADTLGQRARGAAKALERALAAGGDPGSSLAQYLADRLGVPAAAVIGPDLPARLAAARLPGELATEIAAAIERGTAARYGGGGGLEAAAVRTLVQKLEPVAIVRSASSVAVLVVLLAGGTPSEAGAQEPAEAAIAAYRAGDYAAAEQGFARAIERQDDRRLWRARGNCYYRLGDLPRALWAFECARLGLSRDPELLANLRLVRQKLEVVEDAEPFLQAVANLRDRYTTGELTVLCGACMLAAATLLVFGFRRTGLRVLGCVALVPGVLLAVELLWLAPARPLVGVALAKLSLTAEPRSGLEAVATVKPGVVLPIVGGGEGEWLRVQAGDRTGYVPRAQVARVE